MSVSTTNLICTPAAPPGSGAGAATDTRLGAVTLVALDRPERCITQEVACRR
jgi:hypothetical protein